MFGPTPEFEERKRTSGSIEFILGDVTQPETIARVGPVEVVLCAGVPTTIQVPSMCSQRFAACARRHSSFAPGRSRRSGGRPNAAVFFPMLKPRQRRLWVLSGLARQVGLFRRLRARSRLRKLVLGDDAVLRHVAPSDRRLQGRLPRHRGVCADFHLHAGRPPVPSSPADRSRSARRGAGDLGVGRGPPGLSERAGATCARVGMCVVEAGDLLPTLDLTGADDWHVLVTWEACRAAIRGSQARGPPPTRVLRTPPWSVKRTGSTPMSSSPRCFAHVSGCRPSSRMSPAARSSSALADGPVSARRAPCGGADGPAPARADRRRQRSG